MLAHITDNTPTRLTARIFTDETGTQHNTRALETVWTDADLANLALYRIEREPVPEGFIETGRELVFEGGKVIDRPTVEPIPAPTKEEQQAKRQAAFQIEADPLFFKWQAGEGTEEEWLEKREEIRVRFPYPEDDT
jgi:hypothetical protein